MRMPTHGEETRYVVDHRLVVGHGWSGANPCTHITHNKLPFNIPHVVSIHNPRPRAGGATVPKGFEKLSVYDKADCRLGNQDATLRAEDMADRPSSWPEWRTCRLNLN
jgi:hypothetical protein